MQSKPERHYRNQSQGCSMRGRPLWPPAVPRLAARPSQSNPRGSGPEVLKRERGHVTAETGVAEVAVFRALQPNGSEGFDVIIRPAPEGAGRTTPEQTGHYSHYNTKLTNSRYFHGNLHRIALTELPSRPSCSWKSSEHCHPLVYLNKCNRTDCTKWGA